MYYIPEDEGKVQDQCDCHHSHNKQDKSQFYQEVFNKEVVDKDQFFADEGFEEHHVQAEEETSPHYYENDEFFDDSVGGF